MMENDKRMANLNYTCENGHKWKSEEWPNANYKNGKNILGEPSTKCPVCHTEICMCMSEDGKQGAVHSGFKKQIGVGGK